MARTQTCGTTGHGAALSTITHAHMGKTAVIGHYVFIYALLFDRIVKIIIAGRIASA